MPEDGMPDAEAPAGGPPSRGRGKDVVVIGGAAGMWGDAWHATPQLLATGRLDYLVYETLAEITMAILSRAKQRSADLGYAIDIVNPTLRDALPEIHRQGIRVVTNAGGVNPQACADALRAIALELDLPLKVATVEGDDLMPQLAELRAMGLAEIARGTPVPERPISFNAYLGAMPIADALDAGADIVITGRCVDSALVLGPLIHEFGWQAQDLDLLAQGSLAGHLLECSTQVTGGLLTDWEEVPSWVDMGFPIGECHADGSFVITKPPGSDGLVNAKTVTEQILYEIGDPRRYMLPDVVCDFSAVELAADGHDRVRVTGAKGLPPPTSLKACALEQDGWRLTAMLMVGGRDAAARAERAGAAILDRVRNLLGRYSLADFRATDIEALGAEASYGPNARSRDTREAVLKLSAHHDDRVALELLAREFPSIGMSMAQGVTAGGAGRAKATPFIRLHAFLVPRGMVPARIVLDGQDIPGREPPPDLYADPSPSEDPGIAAAPPDAGETVTVPLLALAYARSGDKGDVSNIGVAARDADFLPLIAREVTAEKVHAFLAHLVEGPVVRYSLPGLAAFNFVLQGALGGGGTASLRYDPQGKGLGQMLLEMPVTIPAALSDHRALKPAALLG